MSLTHDLLMMGPVGRPLEEISTASPDDTWFELRGIQWTVEKIGRHVYTFALDDEDASPTGGEGAMSVYVDNAQLDYGRMKMSHLIADTQDELLAMADCIGVQRKWLQNRGTATEHFDVCKAKRELAIAAGALSVGRVDFVGVIRRKRAASPPEGEGSAK
jgi:hypothetical protein